MPLEQIKFSIDGEVQYSRAFDMLAAEAGDLSEPLSEIGDSLLNAVERQFDTQGEIGGSPWKALDSAYAAWKLAHFGVKPILVRTGDMKAAALDKHNVVVTPRKLTYEVKGLDEDGNDLGERAAWHQRGSGNLPQRKIVEMPASERRNWDRLIVAWLNDIRRGPIGRSRS